jgi:hypothetical protein
VTFVRTDVSEDESVFLCSVHRLLIMANVVPFDSFHPDDGGGTFLSNVDSYKSRTASLPRRRHS